MIYFDMSLQQVGNEWGIACEKLELLSQAPNMEDAISSFERGIYVMANAKLESEIYSKADCEIVLDIPKQRFAFKNTSKMFPFILERLKQSSNKSYSQIKDELGAASTGSFQKYFNHKNPTLPGIEMTEKLLKIFNCDLKVS